MQQDISELLHRAEALVNAGLPDQAEEFCRKAVELKPDTLEQWWELGAMAAQAGCFPETELCFREVIGRNSSIPGAWLYLGVALQRQNKLEEAESALGTALHLKPDLAEAYYYLAVSQQSQDKLEPALQNYMQALEYEYEPASTRYNLSLLLQKQGKLEEALDYGYAVLKYHDNLKYRQNFVKLLRVLLPARVSHGMQTEIERCFPVKGLDAATLMKPGMMLLAADPDINRLMHWVNGGNREVVRDRILAGEFEDVFCNELLINLLMYTKIASVEFEKLITVLRKIELDRAGNSPEDMPVTLFDTDGRFMVALACQFFNTDYAAFVTADETAGVEVLASSLEVQIREGEKPDTAFWNRLVILGMYRPLHTLRWAEGCINQAYEAGKFLPVLFKAQWFDYFAEQKLKESIQRLTPVTDPVSTAVQNQYEESPYPRWTSVNVNPPVRFLDDLGSRFPSVNLPDISGSRPDILIAGCGTGRHAIMSASHYQDARVLAIDLSQGSLAYAQRNAAELGITNITFAQADILKLGALEQRFHLIESDGVLHHMDDPEAGLKVLTGLLHDGGFFHLGLYSEIGRRDVVAARKYIHGRGFSAIPDDIRQARRELIGLDADHPARSVLRFRDFFTLGECRDLLFHVQEKRFTIAKIRELLANCGLEFVGFVLSDSGIADRYLAAFPGDTDMRDLDNWEKLEAQYPDIFSEMYQFMCRKI